MLKAIETKNIAIQSEPPSKMNSGTWTQEMDTFEAFFRGKTAEELRTLPSSKRFVNLTVLSGAASESSAEAAFFRAKREPDVQGKPGPEIRRFSGKRRETAENKHGGRERKLQTPGLAVLKKP